MKGDLTLHDIGNDRDVLDAWLDEHEGELIPELEELLADNTESFNRKVERVALYIDELERNAEACKAAAAELTARQKTRENRADGLRAYLCAELARRDVKKVDGTLKTVSRVKNSNPSVRSTVPLETLWQQELAAAQPDVPNVPVVVAIQPAIEYKLNRDEILRRHKAGETIPAGVDVVVGESLRIR